MKFLKLRYIKILLLVSFFVIVLMNLINEFNKQDEISITPLYKMPTPIIEHFDIKEELYIVNFFASWCKACVLEHKNIVELRQNSNITIYGIAVNDNEYALELMMRPYHNPYIKISTSFDGRRIPELEISKIPRMLIIYKNQVIYDHTGEISSKILNKKLLPIINKILNIEPKKEEALLQ